MEKSVVQSHFTAFIFRQLINISVRGLHLWQTSFEYVRRFLVDLSIHRVYQKIELFCLNSFDVVPNSGVRMGNGLFSYLVVLDSSQLISSALPDCINSTSLVFDFHFKAISSSPLHTILRLHSRRVLRVAGVQGRSSDCVLEKFKK